ncbi:GPW/gp25 family protein [Loktanella sp. TSTF-M6]|uniref:GPW/gp25 family protein n=1 Tax=Loktanella gaetbuli TaxID=2881335 RepID=A0ABS8BSA6_9RHOB|nr:GPW/gp25 family protein [Loktanella gaetbuli]MCB5198596.1 GPW/gp25 family protein [Loktanella gaetbuli]
MTGLSRHTGQRLTLDAHLAQSVGVILSTPKGSRVLRRDFGSDLPRLIDMPVTPATVIEVYAATAEAIDLWEPRLTLRRVSVTESAAGRVILDLEAEIAGQVTTRTIPVEVTA